MDFEAVRKNKELIPAEKFLELSEKEKANVQRVKIILPDFDEKGFGTIEVTYKKPIYKALIDG